MKKIIFSDSLLIDYVDDNDYEILKQNIFLILKKEEEKSGRYKSNRGGFQTNDLNHNENKDMIKIIINYIYNLIKKNYVFDKIRFDLDNIWINKNPKMAINMPHIHPRSHFSGVFFIEVPKQDGNLVFFRNEKSSNMMGDGFFEGSDFNVSYDVSPKEKMILLFPSYLQHMVEPHFEEGYRISVSFNIRISHG
jgi:uncharacterized protein (TIGR02466 family)